MVMREKPDNGIFARKTIGATDLKLGMQTLLHSGSNMGWVPPGHTSSFLCVRLNMPKMGDRPMNPYIFRVNIIRGMFKYMYMTTPIFEFISGQKMATNGTLVRETFGATTLRLWYS